MDTAIRFSQALVPPPSAQEGLGQTLDMIIPEKMRARHWGGYRQVMEIGSTCYGQELLAVPATGKDGARISIEFSILLLRSSIGVAGYSR